MKIVTAQTMRELDRRATEEFGIKGETLMDRAGFGVANAVRRLAETSGFQLAFVHLIAGRGNNGGDAFVAARYLKDMGFGVEVWLAGSLAQVTGDAALYLSKLKPAKIRVEQLPTMEDWQAAIRQPLAAEIIVDGVLGTGITGPARGPVAGAIQYIRSQANEALVVSIDIPSGLNADTGVPEGDIVAADVTATMGLPKLGLVAPAAIDYVGAIEVVDIGLPADAVADAEGDDKEMIFLTDLQPLFPRRPRNTHKGDYGHVVIIGGGGAFTGAVTLAARAAHRSGVGLVSAIVPRSLRAIVATASPETMVAAAPEDAHGALVDAALDTVRDFFSLGRAYVVGPGLTRAPATRRLVEAVVREATGPLVIDADALSVMHGEPEYFARSKFPVVLTPHPGEMAALLGRTVADVQDDRIAAARELAARSNAVAVLKGAGTVVARPDGSVFVNATGNPGMAKGGAGDVLSGVLGGLLAQGFSPLAAACAAVYVHGRAGDLAAWRRCQVSLSAGDLIEELSFAFRDLSLR